MISFESEFQSYKMESVFLNNLAAEHGIEKIPERLRYLVGDPSEVNKRIVNVIRNAYEVPWGAANPAAATNPYAAPIGFDDTSAAKLLNEIVQGLSQW
jgi:hypothetical protein